jgi:exopolysaccharide biosynthesis polyprenyl glycosylphosphotransferase
MATPSQIRELSPAPIPPPAGAEPLFAPRPARRNNISRVISALEALIDVCTVLGACFVANRVYYSLELGKRIYYPSTRLFLFSLLFGVIVVFLLDRMGTYQSGTSLLGIRDTERIIRVSIQSAALLFTISYLSNFLFSRWLIGIAVVFVPIGLLIQKPLVGWLVQDLHAKFEPAERVILFGAGMTGRRIFSALVRSPKLGLDPVLFVDEDASLDGKIIHEQSYKRRRSAPIVSRPFTADFIRSCQADRVVITIPAIARQRFMEILQEGQKAGVSVSFVPYHLSPTSFLVDYVDVDGMLLANLRNNGTSFHRKVLKRCFDFLAALTLLILLSPILISVALLIRWRYGCTAFFVQDRVGYHGKKFRLYKFRTMDPCSPAYAKSPDDNSDPRITRLGRYLRRTSFDELPQLINVIRGDMSLVGPRPEMPFIVENYSAIHRQRLAVKPGITGLWQLSADRGHSIHENIEYDLYYIRHQNFFMDVAILLHTLLFAARGI